MPHDKTVEVYSRRQASELEPRPETCFISLSNPDSEYPYSPNYEGWEVV